MTPGATTRALVVVLVGAALSGCGGRSHGSEQSAPGATAAQRYLAAAQISNARVAVAKAHLATRDGDIAAIATDLIAIAEAKERFDGAIRQLKVASPVETDVQTLLKADVVLERALRAAAGAPDLTALGQQTTTVLQAASASVTAANVVRRDLRLPPVP